MTAWWQRTWLVAALVAGLVQAGATAANLVRMGVPFPAGSKGMTDLQTAARSIQKQSAGRVQVKFTEQPELDSAPNACDGALLAGPYLARYSESSRVYMLPLLFRSPAEAAQLQSPMETRIAAELETQGLTLLAPVDLGFAYLHSRQPVETAEQWKASRLWVPPTEPETARMAAAYGVTLVPLEATRVREALHNDLVDAVIVPPLGAILLQWHVEIRSVSETPFLHLCGAVVMKKESLARLEAADQALLRTELARVFAAVAADLRGKEAEAMDVLAQNGVARHPLGATPEQKAGWAAWAAEVADRLVAEGHIAGGTLEQMRQALATLRAMP